MERDFKVCIKCCQAANIANRELACVSALTNKDNRDKYNKDFMKGKKMAGCDKLLEHAVSVGRQKV